MPAQQSRLRAPAAVAPELPVAQMKRVSTLVHEGSLDDALAAIGRSPVDAAEAGELGQALLKAGRASDAVWLLTNAIRCHPADVRLVTLNGEALLALGQIGPALGILFMALDRHPGNALVHAGLAVALFKARKFPEALTHAAEAFQGATTAANALNVGVILMEMGHLNGGMEWSGLALDLQPDNVAARKNRAIAMVALRRFDEAETLFRDVVAMAPNDATARADLADTLLLQGQLSEEAWALYETRLPRTYVPNKYRWWEGEDIAGRTILLHAEQGLGDTLQFVRYAPLVAARGARVVLAVQPGLIRLLQGTPGVDKIVAWHAPEPQFDLVCPLLSLPRIFRTTLDSIPPIVPYARRFKTRLERASGLRVGLVWAGNPTYANDHARSMAADEFTCLAGIPGVQFCNLQRLAQGTAELPPELNAIDLMPGVADFADTADRIAGLDLVIAVDTAVAHLAATMGKPVWLLSRFRGCWRWLLDREDSPWYPSITIYRQPRINDWPDVMERVRQDLTALAAQQTRS